MTNNQPNPEKEYDFVVVGGGPAGVVFSYLAARAGLNVLLLEAYKDFNRRFRGDTLNPLTMGLLDQMGLMDEILALPHNKVREVKAVGAEGAEGYDLTYKRMPSKFPFVMIIAQPIFLDFMVDKARHFSGFNVEMQARVNGLVEEGEKVVGVTYRNAQGKSQLARAKVVIGADGRHSAVRKAANLPTITTTKTKDYVVWFNIPRQDGDPQEGLVAREQPASTLFMFQRPNEWQISLTLRKGVDYKSWKARGIEAMRQEVVNMVPEFANRMAHIEWENTSLLPVELKRAVKWYRDGLLLIGDSAHIMSPFGGIGINVAIRDAVVAANRLARPAAQNAIKINHLRNVQRRVGWEVKLLQKIQAAVQDSATNSDEVVGLPPIARLMLRIPIVRDLPIFLLSFGLVPVRVGRHLLKNEPTPALAVGD